MNKDTVTSYERITSETNYDRVKSELNAIYKRRKAADYAKFEFLCDYAISLGYS